MKHCGKGETPDYSRAKSVNRPSRKEQGDPAEGGVLVFDSMKDRTQKLKAVVK